MPIVVDRKIEPLGQEEFGQIAYRVMECVFDLHREIGRFFDEEVYQCELVRRLPMAYPEVCIEVRFGDYCKRYSIDLVVAPGAVFELKTVEKLHERHQAQLLNYLLLCDLQHGKLVNVRPERVQHRFVNTSLTRADRTRFSVDARDWRPSDPTIHKFRYWMEEALRDWGTCLDQYLYAEAAIHFFGGELNVIKPVEVVISDKFVRTQKVANAGPNAAFQVTTLDPSGQASYQQHLQRFLNHTNLNDLHWINVNREIVTFRTIGRSL
jgi:GxxExxY protein